MHPRLNISSHWRFVPGAAFGLQQASYLGNFQVAIDKTHDFRALDEAMDRFLVELTPRSFSPSNTAHALACRVAHWVSAVQRQNRIPLSPCYHIRSLGHSKGPWQTFFVALPVHQPKAARAALGWVAEALTTLLPQETFSEATLDRVGERYEQLKRILSPFAMPGQNPVYIHQAAWDLDIPIRHLAGGAFLLGQGRNSRWLRSSISDRTASLGVSIAQDKLTTASVLRQAGLPAPTHALAESPEHACALASKLGYPVVVKPADQEQGRGVFADLRDDHSVVHAFHAAQKHSRRILVEKHFDGDGHRLTVCNGKVIGATRKLPAGVTGDGVHTVEQLVAVDRLKPVKRELYAPQRPVLTVDDEAIGMLAQQGLTPGSIPAPEQYVCLRRRNNASSGGKTIPLSLEQVHPDNLRLAVRAADALRLDIAGLDLLIADISKSWFETGALICEVNAQPQMGPQPVYRVLAELTGMVSRIMVHLVVVAEDRTIPSLSAAIGLAGRMGCDGVSTPEGIWVAGSRLSANQANGFDAARVLLTCRETGAALLFMSMPDVLRFGLPADHLDSVTVVGRKAGAIGPNQAMNELIAMIRPHTDHLHSVPGLGGIEVRKRSGHDTD